MKKIGSCFHKHDHQASRNWWEPPHVIYSFNHPRVRSSLERLVETDVVRVTDREFMLKLQKTRKEYHEETLRKKIFNRMEKEVERVKRLILEGKMPVEEAPKELSEHPVFKITLLEKKLIEEEKLKAVAKRKLSKVEKLNYDIFESTKEEVEDYEISSCIDFDMSDAERDRKIEDREDYIALGLASFTDEDFERIKYVDPLMRELQDAEGVDELYRLADEIVGPTMFK